MTLEKNFIPRGAASETRSTPNPGLESKVATAFRGEAILNSNLRFIIITTPGHLRPMPINTHSQSCPSRLNPLTKLQYTIMHDFKLPGKLCPALLSFELLDRQFDKIYVLGQTCTSQNPIGTLSSQLNQCPPNTKSSIPPDHCLLK